MPATAPEQWRDLLSPTVRPGFELLVRAFRYSAAAQSDPWNFAVEVGSLEQAGLNRTDLRWLLASGYAQQADELTHPCSPARQFGPAGLATISPHSCFVLTPAGAQFISELISGGAPTEKLPAPHSPAATTPPTEVLSDRTPNALRPTWDCHLRELSLGGKVIKRYRVPAPNQELILTVFEESGWPPCIDDPLVPTQSVDAKERLKAVIRSLNRNQSTPLIRFHGNGNGCQVYWEVAG